MNSDEFWNQVDEVMKRSIENSTRSIFDEYIKQNSANRASVGITAKIVRKMHSETCEWCRSLAGVYIYGQEPHEVYQRHDNCDCTVEYFCEKGRQNVWESNNKFIEENDYRKKERMSYMIDKGSNKESYKIKSKNLKFEVKSDNEYKKIIRIAKFDKKQVVDVTDIWNKNRKKGIVIKNDFKFYFKGEMYDIYKNKVIYDPSEREIDIANMLSKKFGGIVEINPKINYPNNIRVSDFRFNDDMIDLAEVKNFGKNTIYNILRRKIGQADSVILDISKLNSDEKEIISNTLFHLRSKHMKNFKNIIIVKNDEILKVFEIVK